MCLPPPADRRKTRRFEGLGACSRAEAGEDAAISDIDLPFAVHGGALEAARAAYREAPEPWIDLSTGINPWPYPVEGLAPEAWSRLPDPLAQTALEAVAARRYRARDPAVVVASPGTQALIQRLPGCLGARDVRLLGQTYGEFAAVFRAAGATVRPVATLDALVGADVAVVVNPNNPDGRLVEPAALAALVPNVGTLVVDEAFMDTLGPSQSVVPHLPAARAMVLRSFGKFYGLAGLRLGFAIATPDLVPGLRAALGPWAVSGPALAIGTRALVDDAWVAATRTRLVETADRMDALLHDAGWTLVGGTSLFRLARHGSARGRFVALARAGILTRPFVADSDRLRFGLPGTPAAFERLARALGEG